MTPDQLNNFAALICWTSSIMAPSLGGSMVLLAAAAGFLFKWWSL